MDNWDFAILKFCCFQLSSKTSKSIHSQHFQRESSPVHDTITCRDFPAELTRRWHHSGISHLSWQPSVCQQHPVTVHMHTRKQVALFWLELQPRLVLELVWYWTEDVRVKGRKVGRRQEGGEKLALALSLPEGLYMAWLSDHRKTMKCMCVCAHAPVCVSAWRVRLAWKESNLTNPSSLARWLPLSF